MTSISQLYEQAATGNIPQDIGIGGFKLYAAIVTRPTYDTQAPVSYLEDGEAVTDHLINEPIQLDILINVGDVFRSEGTASGIENLVRRTQAEVGVVTKYLPAQSQAAVQRINSVIASADDAYNALDTYYNEGEQLASFFGDKTETSIQAEFFNFIDKTRNSKHLVNVETPHRTYKNMALVSANPQANNQIYSTMVNLRFQEIRFAKTTTGKILPAENKRAKGTGGDTGSEKNKGDQKGAPEESLASTLLDKANGI